MERKITKLENSQIQVDVVVDEKTWVAAQEKGFKKVASTVEIKGFRKGHAPENLVKAKVDQVKVMDEAINSLLPEIYKEILEKDNVQPFARPEVNVTKVTKTELEVTFKITCAPEVTLGEYKGYNVGKETIKVTDKDVDDAINTLLKQNASLVVKEGTAEKGDTVVIDFVGEVDGKAFEGGTGNNYDLELGSNTFIPGFEDQLVGTKAEDKKDVNVKFPENYTPELKGKDAVFHCTVHEVKSKKLAELNDDFVKELNIKDVTTVDQLKAYKKNEIKTRKENEARSKYLNALLAEIAKNCKVSVPDQLINDQANSRREELTKQMAQSGLTFEQYLTFVGQKEEDFMNKLREDSKAAIVNYLIVNKVGEAENIVIDDKEVEFEYAKLADQYNMKVEDVKKALSAQLDQFKDNVRVNRIEELLINSNN